MTAKKHTVILFFGDLSFEAEMECKILGKFAFVNDFVSLQTCTLKYNNLDVPIAGVDNLFLVSYKEGKYYKVFIHSDPLSKISTLQEGNVHKLKLVACCAHTTAYENNFSKLWNWIKLSKEELEDVLSIFIRERTEGKTFPSSVIDFIEEKSQKLPYAPQEYKVTLPSFEDIIPFMDVICKEGYKFLCVDNLSYSLPHLLLCGNNVKILFEEYYLIKEENKIKVHKIKDNSLVLAEKGTDYTILDKGLLAIENSLYQLNTGTCVIPAKGTTYCSFDLVSFFGKDYIFVSCDGDSTEIWDCARWELLCSAYQKYRKGYTGITPNGNLYFCDQKITTIYHPNGKMKYITQADTTNGFHVIKDKFICVGSSSVTLQDFDKCIVLGRIELKTNLSECIVKVIIRNNIVIVITRLSIYFMKDNSGTFIKVNRHFVEDHLQYRFVYPNIFYYLDGTNQKMVDFDHDNNFIVKCLTYYPAIVLSEGKPLLFNDSHSKRVSIFDYASGEAKFALSDIEPIMGVCEYEGKDYIITYTAEAKKIKLWDNKTGILQYTLTGLNCESKLQSLDLQVKNGYLIGSNNFNLHYWHLASREYKSIVAEDSTKFTFLDNDYFLARRDQDFYLFNASTPEKKKVIKGILL